MILQRSRHDCGHYSADMELKSTKLPDRTRIEEYAMTYCGPSTAVEGPQFHISDVM
ncbi:hypothetical protein HMPREF3223_01227 [Cutibacterium avidum]|nr:hypothetical protein HMPREF3223_01227 [Cutibacterium avidum]